jgi:hypothetical protein
VNRFVAFARNIDRAIASLIWGTRDSTISGEVNDPKSVVADIVEDTLNTVIPGHTQRSAEIDQKIESADPHQ